jgi:DNA repair exonuclease SbcCD ATPase subunit
MLMEADRIHRQFVERIDEAEAKSDQAKDALTAASEKLARHEENLKNAQQQLQLARQRLIQASSDGKTDDERSRRLDDLSLQWHATGAALRATEDKLKLFGGDPRDEVKVLQRQVQALRDETTRHTDKLRFEEGRLQTIVAEAPYTALAAEEETIAELTDTLERETLQAEAIQMLHDTLSRRKRELIESLVGPVRQRAMQTLQRITGTRFEGLELTDAFDVSGIVPRNVAESISLDELSGGEQEQVHFAVRLALADIALTAQRQLVVLDDVFTFTDTARLARIVQILEEAAERFQIVMLTCHPERYRGLPNAKFFDLEEITASSAAGA